MASNLLHRCFQGSRSKTGRMIIMLILTISIAVTEIVFGIRVQSQLLIADGLFSFAEGVALVGSLIALRYARAERSHSKNTFGWARLEILAGLLQEVLLVSLSFSIIVDAVNKIVQPTHIERPIVMIALGSAGVFIGLLGLFLFRGYHHDHNIGHEIVEQKKNDFVRSVHTTLRNLDVNQENHEHPLLPQTNPSISIPVSIPELIVTEPTTTNTNDAHANNHDNEFKIKQLIEHDSVIPSLNDTYKNAFVVSERKYQSRESVSLANDQQLRVPNRLSVEYTRMRSRSGDSLRSSTLTLNQDGALLDDEFENSRVFATLHALSLHSLAVLLESLVVLCSGLLNMLLREETNTDAKKHWLSYIDPILTLITVVVISVKAIPVIWSLGHILVEAVPSGINTHQLIRTIMKTIPEIRAVHSVYVWRATARDVYATLHVVCSEDLPLSLCTEIFGPQLQRILESYCIRHFTLQFEYIEPGGNMQRCAYGTRRRRRGHQSTSEENDKITNQSQIDLRASSFKTDLPDLLRRSV